MSSVHESTVTAAARLESAAQGAGARVILHALDLESGHDFGVDADTLVVLASVFKVPVAVELARQFASGALKPHERLRVTSEDRSPGGTGLSALVDDVEMSLQDLAQLMISVSDNTATDVVTARVGLDAVNAAMRELGLAQTVVEGDCRFLLSRLVTDMGISPEELAAVGADEEAIFASVPAARWAECRDLNAAATNRSTPREITRLLQLVWSDQAAPAEQCAFVRRIMGQQVWPHRLRAGFPGGIRVSGKTGTLPFIRNEVGVVEYPDGGRYAVAVFTVAERPSLHLPAIDALIGEAAGIAVAELRTGR